MRGVERGGSQVLSKCCKVGCSATLARPHVHNFICSESKGLPAPWNLCTQFIAKDHRYYLKKAV